VIQPQEFKNLPSAREKRRGAVKRDAGTSQEGFHSDRTERASDAEREHPLEILIAAVSRYMADAGVAADDDVLMREAAACIAGLVGCAGRGRIGRDARPMAAEGLPKAWLGPEEDLLVPPRRLWLGPSDPISHYYRWAWEYLAYLTLLCDLRRESTVLELGCGHGRTARGLLDYLRYPGHYWGLDVDRPRVENAQARLQSRHPHFEFIWANVYNRHYNPKGTEHAQSLVLPFPDAAFDTVYAASLFTHLLPPEIINYFFESRRVLKRGGSCLFSMFVLDYYRGPGTTISPNYEFPHPYPDHPGVATRDLQYPDNLIGYDIAAIHDFAKRTGLEVVRIIPGLWSNRSGVAVNEQDLILLRHAEA
jgi:SAM-dependent methyltransferase